MSRKQYGVKTKKGKKTVWTAAATLGIKYY